MTVLINRLLMATEAKFFVGQLIHHKKFDYRGVIVDVDATFQCTDEWYELVARSRPPKDKPWYHVLVDNADNMTYVAERHLEVASNKEPINHPAIDRFFHDFQNGTYRARRNTN
jgi:heat shock protein HspQ